MSHNIDNSSISGALLSISTYLMTYLDIDHTAKLGLMLVSAGVGITTIWYNIKKIKKLDNEKR